MNLTRITDISREMNLSTRTLRYYEQIGLIQSVKADDYAYRTYDEAALNRLRHIVLLRKLRIPLKQIALILECRNSDDVIETFRRNLSEVDDEITALTTIREIINGFIQKLQDCIYQDIKLNLLDESALLEAADALTPRKLPPKEERTESDLQEASDKLSRLKDRDVRILYVPPMTVAAFQFIGDGPNEPEGRCQSVINAFVRDSHLAELKPDLRHFGFNAPNPVDETNYHGYEMWVSIPPDMDVPDPLVKKHFEGGLYAAHMIPIGAFEEWEWLSAWLSGSDQYEYRGGGRPDNMFDSLEEQLNYIHRYTMDENDDTGLQLDLLIPIRPKHS
jgi:DNA-binding transcriptional MerR regulator